MLSRAEKILLFLVLFFLPTQLGKHFWPEFSFLYSLPIDYFSPVIYFWDLLVILLLIVSLLQKKVFSKKAITVFLIFLLTQAVSLLFWVIFQNPYHWFNLGAGLVRIEQYFIVGLFGVYIASLGFGDLKKQLFLPIALSIILISSLGILQFINGGTIGLWILGERTFTLSTPAIAKFDFHGQQFLRPYSTLPHPNVLAAFIILMIPLLFLTKQKKNYRTVFLSSLTLSSVVLLLTVSRIGIIAYVMELIYFVNINFLKRLKQIKLLTIFAVLILSITVFPFLYTRFSSTFTFDEISVFRREGLSLSAIEIIKINPLFGVGINNFIPAMAEELIVGPSRFLQPVHNIYLLLLSETGVIGLFGFLILIGFAIYQLFQIKELSISNTLLFLWIVVIFLGFFDHYLLSLPQGYRMLFLIWGVSLSSKTSDKSNHNLFSSR